ncbi:MAG: TolC family protein [Parvibaculum sp.]|nr:TolC family protein [Parvibaculum sp.]
MQKFKGLLLTATLLALGGCAVYSPHPLPQAAHFITPTHAKESHPLTMVEVAQRAVLFNLDLEIERKKKNVSQTQAFQAGLLPNPQFSATIDHPTDNGPGLFNGYSYGLTFDLLALITHPANAAIAEAKAKQAKEDLLWQELQTVARARLLFVQSQMAGLRVSLLSKARTSLNFDMNSINAAMRNGDLAPDQADGDISVLLDIQSLLGAAQRKELRSLGDLRALVNLAPDAPLDLQGLGAPEVLSEAATKQALKQVVAHRPDLIALRDGYDAQEEAVFKAVLSQFPNLQIGFTKASDTSNVHTTSFGVTMNLPIFDRGQGQIAIERATREQLRAEYQNRINQTEGSAAQLRSENTVIADRIKILEPEIALLQARALNAAKAARSGDLSAASEMQFIQSWLNRQNEQIDLREALWTNVIALDTLLASPMQDTSSSDKDAPQ